jgi:hypothetical protein
MAAISIGPEYWWNEADYSRNVTVRSNTFRNNMLQGRKRSGTVWIHGDGAIGNGAITITGNRFEGNYLLPDVMINYADGAVVSSNSFTLAASYPAENGTAVVESAESTNVTTNANTFKNIPPGASEYGSVELPQASR